MFLIRRHTPPVTTPNYLTSVNCFVHVSDHRRYQSTATPGKRAQGVSNSAAFARDDALNPPGFFRRYLQNAAPPWYQHSLAPDPLKTDSLLRCISQTRWPSRTLEPYPENLLNSSELSPGEGLEVDIPGRGASRDMEVVIEWYLSLRSSDDSSIAQLSPATYLSLAKYALSRGLTAVLGCLIEDVTLRLTIGPEKSTMVARNLLIFTANSKAIMEDQMIALLRAVSDPQDAARLSGPVLAGACVTLAQCSADKDTADLMKVYVPLILNRLQDASVGSWNKTFTWAAMCLIQRCLAVGDEAHAYALFETLISTKRIPEMMVAIPGDHKLVSFKSTILLILIRTCEYWYWNKTAASLLRDLLHHDSFVSDPHMMQYILEHLTRFLKGSWKGTAEYSAPIVCMLASKASAKPLPASFLQLFYETARQQEDPASAETVYSFLRWHEATRRHKYLPPQDRAMKWILQYILLESRTVWIARDIYRRILEFDLRLPENDRAEVITLAAMRGFSRYARKLWERYAEGEDACLVTANAACVLRIVSLFTKLDRKEQLRHELPEERETTLEQTEALALPSPEDLLLPSQGKTEALNPEEEVDVDGDAILDIVFRTNADLDSEKQQVQAQDLTLEARLRDQSDSDQLSSEFDDQDATKWFKEEKGPVVSSNNGGCIDVSVPNSEIGWREFGRFAHKVLGAYRASIEPLQSADHTSLNALARGYFMLGDFDRGVDVFGTELLGRKEVPDVHDINVILLPLAKSQPRRAARMLERMQRGGLKPDGVSFGTVLHQAIEHEDVVLVHWLFRLARTAGVLKTHEGFQRFTAKSLFSLITAIITPKLAAQLFPQSQPKENLQRALKLMSWARKNSIVQTPNMGIVGVQAALDASEVELAFEFWSRLMRGKQDWDGETHRMLRRQLGAGIRKEAERRSPRIAKEARRAMLDQLGELREGGELGRRSRGGRRAQADADDREGQRRQRRLAGQRRTGMVW